MLTEREQDIIRRWNDFYLKPRQGSVKEQRKWLAEYFEEFNANPPIIGAYHEAVQLKAGLAADIAVPRDRWLASRRYLHTRRRVDSGQPCDP